MERWDGKGPGQDREIAWLVSAWRARARGRSPLDDRRPPARVAWQTRARAQALVRAASEIRGGVTLGLGSGGGS